MKNSYPPCRFQVHFEGNLGDQMETIPVLKKLHEWGVTIDCYLSVWMPDTKRLDLEVRNEINRKRNGLYRLLFVVIGTLCWLCWQKTHAHLSLYTCRIGEESREQVYRQDIQQRGPDPHRPGATHASGAELRRGLNRSR